LVAVFGVFGEQFEDNRTDGGIDLFGEGGDRFGDVAVDHFHRIGAAEGQVAGEHLVEGDAEGVVVAAVVELAVHSPGLFGGHVGEGAFDLVGVEPVLPFVFEAAGDGEVDQFEFEAVGVDEDVVGFDVFVDDSLVVELMEGLRELEGDGEGLFDCGAMVAEVLVEGLAVEVGEDEGEVGVAAH